MPNPRTPPLKVSKLVGPLNPSVLGRLSTGDAVEVRQQEVGLRGSWYPAKVLQVRPEPSSTSRLSKNSRMFNVH